MDETRQSGVIEVIHCVHYLYGYSVFLTASGVTSERLKGVGEQDEAGFYTWSLSGYLADEAAVLTCQEGSVSHYILHHSTVPVLIVHDDEPLQVLETAAAA